MQHLKIGFIIDPIQQLNPKKDSTVALMKGAQDRGFDIAFFTIDDLEAKHDTAFGTSNYLALNYKPKNWYTITKQTKEPLSNFDVIFMRKDPPFNMKYITITYILDLVEKEGTLVVNKPSSLRNTNEKIAGLHFKSCFAPSLLTRSKASILEFLEKYDKIVLKPLDKMGGKSIFLIQKNDPNTNVIIEEITNYETRFVMAQNYIKEVKTTGDKRILLINGDPIAYGISRLPQGYDHRANIAVSGRVKGFELTEKDKALCAELKSELIKKQLFFVGIDVIGNYITEINVTSPTGIVEITESSGIDVTSAILNALEVLLKSHKNT